MSNLCFEITKREIQKCLRIIKLNHSGWSGIIWNHSQGQLWEYYFLYITWNCSHVTVWCHMNVTCNISALDQERVLLLLHFITFMSRWRYHQEWPSFLFLHQTCISSCTPVRSRVSSKIKIPSFETVGSKLFQTVMINVQPPIFIVHTLTVEVPCYCIIGMPPIFLSLVLILEKRLFLEHIINFEFSHFWRVHDSSFLFRGDHHRHVTPWSPIIYPLTGVLLIIPTVLFSQDTLCELTCYVF